jgi:16S rRNA processing protein RimM
VRIEQVLQDDRVFEPGRRLIIATRASEQPSAVEGFRWQHGRSVLKLRGIDTISEAQQIIGAELRIERSDLPKPEAGAFYTFQLKGCRVFADGACVGSVTEVLDFGGTEILQVENGTDELLVPFAQAYIKKIDLDERRIDVELPEGLRDLNRRRDRPDATK